LDDTLFDHRFAVGAGLRAMRREHASLRSTSLSALEARYSGLLEISHREVMAGRLGEEAARTERFRRLFAEVGEPVETEEAARRARFYRGTYLEHQRLVPGARVLLEELRQDRTIVVLTNNRQEEQEAKLRVVGADALVDALVTAEVVGSAKPDPRMFEAAVRAAGVDRQSCVMVGDSWESDIEGGRRAGLRVAWFNPHRAPAPREEAVAEIVAWRPVRKVATLLRALSPS
jgi:HAD superfamily hydrolase (TIGR01509 family)